MSESILPLPSRPGGDVDALNASIAELRAIKLEVFALRSSPGVTTLAGLTSGLGKVGDQTDERMRRAQLAAARSIRGITATMEAAIAERDRLAAELVQWRADSRSVEMHNASVRARQAAES